MAGKRRNASPKPRPELQILERFNIAKYILIKLNKQCLDVRNRNTLNETLVITAKVFIPNEDKKKKRSGYMMKVL